mmetsp:Transcript_6360/g.13085  ORF Transcript_6360/g.13085 Transcript_6360/m.13085 type:complete len:101 (-) Transcript_6360:112-414(-)
MKSSAILVALVTIKNTYHASAQLSKVHHNSVSVSNSNQDNEWGRIGKNRNNERTLRGSRRRLAKSEKEDVSELMSMSMPELEEFGFDFESSMPMSMSMSL